MELSQGTADKVMGEVHERGNEYDNHGRRRENKRGRATKTMKVALLMAGYMAAIVMGSFTQEKASAELKVLADGAGAKYKRFDNMHQTRYIESLLAGREAKTGKLVAACYNTMFTSKGVPASKDTAPQALVEGLDFDKMKKEYGLVGASLNGPKLWLPD
jgi:hypothetical protein